jgi:putative sterol carrier protein
VTSVVPNQRGLGDLLSAPIQVPTLKHVRGSLRVEVGERCLGVIQVQDGIVVLLGPDAPAEAVVTTSEEDALYLLLRGEMNAIVASIQGQLDLAGDAALAAKVIHAIQVDGTFRTDKRPARRSQS